MNFYKLQEHNPFLPSILESKTCPNMLELFCSLHCDQSESKEYTHWNEYCRERQSPRTLSKTTHSQGVSRSKDLSPYSGSRSEDLSPYSGAADWQNPGDASWSGTANEWSQSRTRLRMPLPFSLRWLTILEVSKNPSKALGKGQRSPELQIKFPLPCRMRPNSGRIKWVLVLRYLCGWTEIHPPDIPGRET